MSKVLFWIQAARLPSQSYIFIPLLLGQSFAYLNFRSFDWVSFFLVQSFGIFNQLFIVFANDYADMESDKLNKTFTIFSGGSRVIVEGKLKPSQLKFASIIMAILCICFSLILCFYHHNPYFLPLCILALSLLIFYSYPPLKLSYRGGGEFLQTLGVGLILPLFGYFAQSGDFSSFPYIHLYPLLFGNLACAIATSLPDVPSDTLSEKRTIAVVWGSQTTKVLILILELMVGFYFISDYFMPISRSLLPTAYFLFPSLIVLSLLGFFAKPGNFKLSIFVFFSIAFHLMIQVLWIFSNFLFLSAVK